MRMMRPAIWGVLFTLAFNLPARAEVILKDVSLDHPIILDSNTDYVLRRVNVTGLADCAALTLAGRIRSVTLDSCSFGRVTAGPDGRAAGLACSGAIVDCFKAVNTSFFDAEEQLASLKEGAFGTVTFDHCRFSASDKFIQDLRQATPWRNWAPLTEFYNIDRLELFDNDFTNTVIVIHPSVKQVIIRGPIPGLVIENPKTTRLVVVETALGV
jgi:hypothetical protein